MKKDQKSSVPENPKLEEKVSKLCKDRFKDLTRKELERKYKIVPPDEDIKLSPAGSSRVIMFEFEGRQIKLAAPENPYHSNPFRAIFARPAVMCKGFNQCKDFEQCEAKTAWDASFLEDTLAKDDNDNDQLTPRNR